MKRILAVSYLCVLTIICKAQTITGKVFIQNSPAIGATIQNVDTGYGTQSDSNGQWSIEGIKGHSVIISYIGYEDVYFTVDEQTNYTTSLIPTSLALDEIVVTALGLKRKNKALGYAVQSISNEELESVQSLNFVNNLSAKLAGVTITQGATGIGSTSKISIRGESSFRNNNPLFVIDGLPINNETYLNTTDETASGFQEIDFGNNAMDVNTFDIESISVLKGPSAAALYGTRAANGAIVISTKKADNSKGLGINFNARYSLETPFRLPQFQNKFGQGNSGMFSYKDGLGGGVNDNITYSYGPELDQGILLAQFDSPVLLPNGGSARGADNALHDGSNITPTPFVSNPDNLKDFYQVGSTRTHNISFDQATNNTNFRLSLTDTRNTSHIPGVNLNRQTVHGNWNFNPSQKLEISSSLSYIFTQSDNRPASGYGSENINYSLVAWMGRQTNIESLRNYWQPGLDGLQQFSFNYTFFDNPFFILHENKNAFDKHRIFGNISGKYSLTKRISIMIRSGIDNLNELRSFRRAYSSNRFNQGAYAENGIQFRELNTDALINFNQQFGHFKIDLNIGANRMHQFSQNNQIQAIGLAQPGIFNLSNNAAPVEVFQVKGEKQINSIYGFAQFGFKNFLYVDITGRNDWSSALATPSSTTNTSFFYPSLSASAILSNFFLMPTSISFFKLRANVAQVGNDTDPYQTSGAFIPQTSVFGEPTFSDQTFIPNQGLIPEKTTAFEIGTDIRFFDDRLNIDLSYYNSTNSNQILALPIPISSGYTQEITNGGSIQSRGFEIIIGTEPIRNNNLRWLSQINFSTNQSIVKDLPSNAGAITLAYSRVYDNTNQTVWFLVEEGDEIGNIWGTGYLKNDDGDFIVGEDGKLIVDNSLKKLGNYNPDFILGLNNQIAYKNWNFGFLLDWRQGGQLVSRTLALAGVGGQLLETENRPEEGLIFDGVVNIGTEENPIYEQNNQAINPETYYRQFYDRNHEENNIYDASYIKLRELSLKYTFKPSNNFIKGPQGVEIGLFGRNLFAISKIQHFDPEQIAVQGNTFVNGVEDMSYPSARSIGCSLSIKL